MLRTKETPCERLPGLSQLGKAQTGLFMILKLTNENLFTLSPLSHLHLSPSFIALTPHPILVDILAQIH